MVDQFSSCCLLEVFDSDIGYEICQNEIICEDNEMMNRYFIILLNKKSAV